MNHKGIIAAIILFGIIIIGMFVFAFLKKSELTEAPVPRSEPVVVSSPYDSITRIDAKHFFSNGTHTLVGEMQLPTPCDLLNWNPLVMESMPEQVRIDFTVVNNTDTCTQVVTPQKFFVEFTASEQAQMEATLNGRKLELNLIPAAPGEKPEDYEFSPKG